MGTRQTSDGLSGPLYEHPLVIQTAYAELRQICLDEQAETPGVDILAFDATGRLSATSKTIRGKVYWYAQYTDAEGKRRQSYLGPDDDPKTQQSLQRLRSGVGEDDLLQRRNLVRLLKQAGYGAPTHLACGALTAMHRIGLFRAGMHLVGTPAYQAILNRLGVQERPLSMTNDVDVAIEHISLSLPGDVDIQQSLAEWSHRLFAVPSLDRDGRETSLKIRGKDFRIDFLAPGLSTEEGSAVSVPSLGFHATRMPFMDYLLADAEQTLVLTPIGALVPAPNAARFMLHKLAVAASRPAAWESKRKKDIHQAKNLYLALREQDPESLETAIKAALTTLEPALLLSRISAGLARPDAQALGALRARVQTLLSDAAQAPRNVSTPRTKG